MTCHCHGEIKSALSQELIGDVSQSLSGKFNLQLFSLSDLPYGYGAESFNTNLSYYRIA